MESWKIPKIKSRMWKTLTEVEKHVHLKQLQSSGTLISNRWSSAGSVVLQQVWSEQYRGVWHTWVSWVTPAEANRSDWTEFRVNQSKSRFTQTSGRLNTLLLVITIIPGAVSPYYTTIILYRRSFKWPSIIMCKIINHIFWLYTEFMHVWKRWSQTSPKNKH